MLHSREGSYFLPELLLLKIVFKKMTVIIAGEIFLPVTLSPVCRHSCTQNQNQILQRKQAWRPALWRNGTGESTSIKHLTDATRRYVIHCSMHRVMLELDVQNQSSEEAAISCNCSAQMSDSRRPGQKCPLPNWCQVLISLVAHKYICDECCICKPWIEMHFIHNAPFQLQTKWLLQRSLVNPFSHTFMQ